MEPTRNNYQDKQILHLDEKVEKHIETTNAELVIIKVDVAVIKTTVKGHDRLLWIIVTGIIVLILQSFI